MKGYISAFPLTVFLFSCNGPQYEMITIPQPEKLNVISEQSIPQDCASGILFADSLIITANVCGIGAFSVYTSDQLMHMIDFGIRGNHMSEFDTPSFYNDLDYCGPTIGIYDINRLEEKTVDLEAVLRGENMYGAISDIRLPQEIYWARNPARMNGKFLGSDVDPGNKMGPFFIFDRDSRQKKYIDYSPRYSFRKNNTAYYAYYNDLLVNEKEGVIAVAYRHLDMVQLYDPDGELIRSMAFSKVTKPQENTRIGGVDYSYPDFNVNIFGCRDYFFIIRLGMSKEDYEAAEKENTILLKFNWQGNLLASLSLPGDFFTLACNQNGDTFYGVTPTDDPEYARLVMIR